jgi:hypothetical protein
VPVWRHSRFRYSPQHGFFCFASHQNYRITPPFPPNVAENRRIFGHGDDLWAHLACYRVLRNPRGSIKRHVWPLVGHVKIDYVGCEPERRGNPAELRAFFASGPDRGLPSATGAGLAAFAFPAIRRNTAFFALLPAKTAGSCRRFRLRR